MLTQLQKQYGPWAVDPPGRYSRGSLDHSLICTVAERLPMIKESFDHQWLRAVIADLDSTKTVRQAAERRLRKLRKQQ